MLGPVAEEDPIESFWNKTRPVREPVAPIPVREPVTAPRQEVSTQSLRIGLDTIRRMRVYLEAHPNSQQARVVDELEASLRAGRGIPQGRAFNGFRNRRWGLLLGVDFQEIDGEPPAISTVEDLHLAIDHLRGPRREPDAAPRDYVDAALGLTGQPQSAIAHPIQTVVESLAAIGVPCNISMTDGLHEDRTVTLTFNPYAGYHFDTNVEYTPEGGVALTFTFNR